VADSGVVWVQLTGGISKGMAMLTLDQDYISRFRNQPMTAQQRLIYALQALGVGMYEGVIGQRLLGLPACLSVCVPCLEAHMCLTGLDQMDTARPLLPRLSILQDVATGFV